MPGARHVGRLNRNGKQRADDDHRRDCVRHRHQRRMQRERDAPHDVIADENRKDEDRDAKDEFLAALLRRLGGESRARDHRHRDRGNDKRAETEAETVATHGLGSFGLRLAAAVFAGAPSGLPPRRSAIMALTMAPSREMSVPLTSSSSQLIASVFFSLSIRGSTKAWRFRA